MYIAVIHNSGSTYTFNARWTIGVYKITARCSETIYDNQREEYKTFTDMDATSYTTSYSTGY